MRVHNHGFDPLCGEIETPEGLKGECMFIHKLPYNPKGSAKITPNLDGATDVNPTHYDFPGGVQVIDITKHLDFLTGNVVKYVCRAGRKGDRMTDLLKAQVYLQWLIDKESEK